MQKGEGLTSFNKKYNATFRGFYFLEFMKKLQVKSCAWVVLINESKTLYYLGICGAQGLGLAFFKSKGSGSKSIKTLKYRSWILKTVLQSCKFSNLPFYTPDSVIHIIGSSPVGYTKLILTADVKQRKQNILNNEPNPDNSP